MKRLLALGVLFALLSSPACRRKAASAGTAKSLAPRGDAVWLTDPAALGEPALEQQLARLSGAAVFVNAGELGFEAGRWIFRADPEPPRPLQGTPAVLAVRPSAEVETAVRAPEGADPKALAHALAAALAPAAREGGPYGRVAGVHLDFPFSAAGAERAAQMLAALRRELPAGLFLSISMREAPATEEEQEKLAPLVDAADALVAIVFGPQGSVDPVAIDALHRPWWAGYEVAARAMRISAGGQSRGAVPERYLDALAGNQRVEFENDLSLSDPNVAAFNLIARSPVRLEGLSLEPGDRVAYRLPSLPEMLSRLGSTMAGKRYALGRIVVFEGASEAERSFSMAALEDVILGRSLAPALEVEVRAAARNAVLVSAVNRSHHGSMASRMSNWVEVDLAPARAADVVLGGFDRYEVYDASGLPVTPGRATRVRLFETLLSAGEVVTPARIAARGRLPARCCRYRSSLIGAAGGESATDWMEPAPEPTPTPSKAKAKAKPRPKG